MKRPADNVEPLARPPGAPLGPRRSDRAEFLRRLGVLVGLAVGVSALLALLSGQFGAAGVSNFLFLSAFVLLVIAALPIVSEVGSGVALMGQAALEHKSLGALLAGERQKRERGAQRTFLYGLAGRDDVALKIFLAAGFQPVIENDVI